MADDNSGLNVEALAGLLAASVATGDWESIDATLTDIEAVLIGTDFDLRLDLLRALDTGAVFACVAGANGRTLEKAVTLLRALSRSTRNEQPFLYGDPAAAVGLPLGLAHPHPTVRILTLDVLQDAAENGTEELAQVYAEALVGIWALFADDEVGVSLQAARLMATLVETTAGRDVVLGASGLEALQRLVESESAEVSLRALSFVAELIKAGASEAVARLEECGVTEALFDVSIFASDGTGDILVQLNVVEILRAAVASREGAAYVAEQAVLPAMWDTLTSSPPRFLARPLTELFVGLAAHHADLSAGFDVVGYCAGLILADDADEGAVEVAITSLIGFAEGVAGMGAVLRRGDGSDVGQAYLERATEYVVSSDRDLRIAALHSVAAFFESKAVSAGGGDGTGQDDDSLWQPLTAAFEAFNERMGLAGRLLTALRQPFPELRHAVFHLVRAALRFPAGVRSLLNEPGFYELMTNRDTETEHAGMEWKADIIGCIVEARAVSYDVLGATRFHQLAHYLKTGAFAGTARVEVATSGGA